MTIKWAESSVKVIGEDFVEVEYFPAVHLDLDEYGRALEIRVYNEDGGVATYGVPQ